MNTIKLSQLPADIQAQVKGKLSAYDQAYVTLENGVYTYTAGLYLDTRQKAADFKTFVFTKDDAFTKEEQRANYAALTNAGNWEYMNC